MNFSIALMNLLIGVSLATNADDIYGDIVRDELKDSLGRHGISDQNRRLDASLNTDFSWIEGDWYKCLQTTLMTFNGEPADKHVVEQRGCNGGRLGTASQIGDLGQTWAFEINLLNHCWFHDLGGPGEPPCPNDTLAGDPRGDGNVLVKYHYSGIGSFAKAGTIDMHSDHTYLQDGNGDWQPNLPRAKIENIDTLSCHEYADGIVCDWRINEYRTQEIFTNGCKKNGNCKANWNENKCARKGGEWTDECGTMGHIDDGFVYDSFGSYYLVKDMADCHVECTDPGDDDDDSPTAAPDDSITGCYKGGRCNGNHGCCDCDMTEEECDFSQGFIWVPDGGCASICWTDGPTPSAGDDDPAPEPTSPVAAPTREPTASDGD